MRLVPPAVRTALIFAIIVFSWGCSYVAAKVGLPFSRPFSFATLSTFCGGAALALAAFWRTHRLPRDPYLHLSACILGILNSTMYVGLVNLALATRGVSAGLASILTFTQPLMVVVLARLFLAERTGRRRLIGVVLGFGGMTVALSNELGMGAAPLRSYLYLLGAALSWGLGTVGYRYIHGRIDLLWNTALQGIYASVPLGLAAWALDGGLVLRPTPLALAALAELSLLSSGLAMWLYFYLLSHHAAVKVGALLFAVPLTSVALGVLLLGERLSPLLVIGSAGVLVGIYLVNSAAEATGDVRDGIAAAALPEPARRGA